MATIHRLPEELVRDVLTYALRIPLEEFFLRYDGLYDTKLEYSDPDARAPPQYHILLVCKRWHRIGLPVLYTSLALSSDRQTKRVAATIQIDPHLGRAIRHVRLRGGGYGPELYTILKAATKLDAISIATTMSVRDSLAGLRRVLPTLDPRVLCVYSPRAKPGGRGVKDGQLDALLQSMVREWKNMETVYFCPDYLWLPSSLLQALAVAPSLKTVSFDAAHLGLCAQGREFVPLDRLATNPGLDAIVVRGLTDVAGLATVVAPYSERFRRLAVLHNTI